MGMTKKEQATRNQLAEYLGDEGHGKYAEYLMLFDLHFMSDKEAENGGIAYMLPDKGMIFINKDINDIDIIDLLLRHEMLHQYLRHGKRYQNIIKQKLNITDDEEPRFEDPIDANVYQQISNIAADYELSKFYSPDKDFLKAKNIPYKDTFVQGLVLELDHPEWLELSYEELFAELEKEFDKIKEQFISDSKQKVVGQNRRSIQEQAQDMQDQAAEMEETAAKLEKELSQKMGGGNKQQAEIDKLKKDIQNIRQNAKQLTDQAEELTKDSENRSAAFNEPGADKKRQEQLDKIKDFWDKLENSEQLAQEMKDRIYDDRRIIAIKQKKYGDMDYIRNLKVAKIELEPMKNFILDLNKTIKKQLASSDSEEDTFTKKPLVGTAIKGVYRPGQIANIPKKIKPNIQVIYDRSGSWMPEHKTRAGDLALYTIKKKYVDKGLINLNVFYCSTGPVTSNRQEADRGGGGLNGNAVIEHIMLTKPDNVIIMTDSDPDSYTYDSLCKIPGTAWFLFYDSTAPIFAGHIQAKSKKYYDLRNTAGLEEIAKKITK